MGIIALFLLAYLIWLVADADHKRKLQDQEDARKWRELQNEISRQNKSNGSPS